MNDPLEALRSGQCPHGLYVGTSAFKCKDCEIADLDARCAAYARLASETNDRLARAEELLLMVAYAYPFHSNCRCRIIDDIDAFMTTPRAE